MTDPAAGQAEAVLRFWFEESTPEDWFKKSDEFDAKIRDRFLQVYEAAVAGRLEGWRETAAGCLALILVLDQFPRNLFRDDPRAFATDAAARDVTAHVLARGFDMAPEIAAERRIFFYMPLEHSEDLADQQRCVELVRTRIDSANYLDYAERHLRVIERFGRFPHRNAVLGRTNTPEEAAYLAEPGAGF